MKKYISIMLIVLLFVFTLCGCNFNGYDWIDTNYHFDKAIIKMPNGEVLEVEIQSWADAEGEQLTITAKDGTKYLVSSINCVLIESKVQDNDR